MNKNTKLKGLLSPLLKHIRIKKALKYIKKNATILDIGCDDAYILKYLSNFKDYVGIDINNEIIEDNRKKYSHLNNVSFFNLNAEHDLEKINKQFDTILMTAIIEHLKDYKTFFEKLSLISRENAILIITTPTKFSDKILKIGAKFRLFSKESLEEHEKYFNKNDFEDLKDWTLKSFSYFELFMNQLIILEKK